MSCQAPANLWAPRFPCMRVPARPGRRAPSRPSTARHHQQPPRAVSKVGPSQHGTANRTPVSLAGLAFHLTSQIGLSVLAQHLGCNQAGSRSVSACEIKMTSCHGHIPVGEKTGCECRADIEVSASANHCHGSSLSGCKPLTTDLAMTLTGLGRKRLEMARAVCKALSPAWTKPPSCPLRLYRHGQNTQLRICICNCSVSGTNRPGAPEGAKAIPTLAGRSRVLVDSGGMTILSTFAPKRKSIMPRSQDAGKSATSLWTSARKSR